MFWQIKEVVGNITNNLKSWSPNLATPPSQKGVRDWRSTWLLSLRHKDWPWLAVCEIEHDDKPFYQEKNDIKSYVFSQVHVNEGWKKIIIAFIICEICLHLGGEDIYSILSIFCDFTLNSVLFICKHWSTRGQIVMTRAVQYFCFLLLFLTNKSTRLKL